MLSFKTIWTFDQPGLGLGFKNFPCGMGWKRYFENEMEFKDKNENFPFLQRLCSYIEFLNKVFQTEAGKKSELLAVLLPRPSKCCSFPLNLISRV